LQRFGNFKSLKVVVVCVEGIDSFFINYPQHDDQTGRNTQRKTGDVDKPKGFIAERSSRQISDSFCTCVGNFAELKWLQNVSMFFFGW
jgi:hypothetical protein